VPAALAICHALAKASMPGVVPQSKPLSPGRQLIEQRLDIQAAGAAEKHPQDWFSHGSSRNSRGLQTSGAIVSA
jgi:hypothetical protein